MRAFHTIQLAMHLCTGRCFHTGKLPAVEANQRARRKRAPGRAQGNNRSTDTADVCPGRALTVDDKSPITLFGRHFHRQLTLPVNHTFAAKAEDDGYLISYVYDQDRDASDVVILNAQAFDDKPLATIRLPVRVPYGFHGNWIADQT